MKKKLFFTKVINVSVGCIILAMAAVSITGCHKKEGQPAIVEYSDIMGTAQGIADFQSTDAPEINIKDIQSYLGQEIDYSSGIDIKNVDDFEDFQMWVDATGVDIYTVGRYTATYQFVFGGKTLEKTIGVTILQKEESAGDSSSAENSQNSGSDSSDKNSQSGNEGGNGVQGNSVQGNDVNGEASNGNAGNTSNGGSQGENAGSSANGGSQGGNTGNTSNGGSQGGNTGNTPNGGSQGGNTGNTSNGGSQGGNTGSSSNGGSQGGNAGSSQNGGSQSGNTGNSSNGNTSNENREIITSSQSGTKKASTIGYANIELLSGKYVKLKCTDARYIVSTRTDESQTVKNDKTYHTSKLVVTFNTGEERVLETVEKAVN